MSEFAKEASGLASYVHYNLIWLLCLWGSVGLLILFGLNQLTAIYSLYLWPWLEWLGLGIARLAAVKNIGFVHMLVGFDDIPVGSHDP